MGTGNQVGMQEVRLRRVRGAWAGIVTQAAQIVESYDTEVTLRQLFYRLVSAGVLRNTQAEYNQLSKATAQARREGAFPALIDRGRAIHRYRTWTSPQEALAFTAKTYRRDRTEGQEATLYLGVEKAGIVEQLLTWFGNYGLPILALGGYSSQTYIDDIEEDARRQKRPTVLVYAGDYDPSGEDILRDFVARASFGCVERIALNKDQVEAFSLPPMPGKRSDTRAKAFEARHGELVQVELDALPPDTLRGLFREAVDRHFDFDVFENVTKREERERNWAIERAGTRD